RLDQIEVQVAERLKNADIFKKEHVAKALNLSTKQKETIRESLSDLDKDQKELREEAKGDFQKMRETMQKIQKLRAGTFAKITKGFNDEQKKAWTELKGKEFKMEMGFGPGGGGKRGKKKDKSDF